MLISEMIAALEKIKEDHGDVPVGKWVYSGGSDNLCGISPEFDEEVGYCIMDSTRYIGNTTR